MRLKLLKYFPFRLKFKNQFTTATNKQNSRKIFILQLEDENGEKLFSEAAPLPEYRSENFDEVEEELKRLTQSKFFEVSASDVEIFDYTKTLTTLPTLQYAFEHLLMQALKSNKIFTEHDLTLNKRISVNAVLDINNDETTKTKFKNLVESGFNVFKIKASNNNFEDVIDFISWSQTESDIKLKFRIDPNGSWSKNETVLRAGRLEKLPIEFIEQPVMNKTELIELADQSPIAIAADESIRNFDEAIELIENSNLKFLVIKPMLFGGLQNVLKLQSYIEGKDIHLIISSSLESNIARRHLTLIAASVQNKFSHGLATSELFANQPIEDLFSVSNGEINYSHNLYKAKMKVNL